jgi:CRP-like cAMP-binding protein
MVVEELREEHFAAGDIVMQQGQAGDKFCVIERGRVSISVESDGVDTLVNERGPGEYVGEVALLRDVLRTATVRALTDLALLSLPRQGFDRLLAGSSYVSGRFARGAGRRVHRTVSV